ncbi:MAG: TIGR02391 family protein [Planctomycetes bacterium]|nr:TIGR02391 family protein [Planctomycetota bacterium]
MSLNIDELLHPRILTHCKKLIDDGHYKHAAYEAMTQVELALKEKSGIKNKYGVRLVKSLFGNGKSIKLRVPFGDELQEQAEGLFVGAFSYYRNYTAHDGARVDPLVSRRILVLASELLDLIGASDISFSDIGGLDGLVQSGTFKNKDQIFNLLKFLNGNILPDHVCDGFYEDLISKGFTESQLQAVIETGLVEYISESYIANELDRLNDAAFEPDELGCFQLTNLGKETLAI